MKGILISPRDRSVTAVELAGGDIDDIYGALKSGDDRFSGTVDVRELGAGATLWFDDIGCLRQGTPLFQLRSTVAEATADYAGAGLVLGSTADGETADCPISLAQMKAVTTFPELETSGTFGPGSKGEVEHPTFGKTFVIHTGAPIWQPRGTWVPA